MDFVRSVNPAQYAAIFKDALNAGVVSIIAQALKLDVEQSGATQFAESALHALPSVPRFTMVTGMMTRADKAPVAALLDAMAQRGADVSQLRSKFRA